MDTVKIFRSYRDAAKMLAASSEGAAYQYIMAVLDYGLDGIEPQLEGPAAAMFLLTRPNLDVSIKKAESGSRGGSSCKPNQTDSKSDDKQTASKTEASSKQTASKQQASSKQMTSKMEAEEGSRKKEVGRRIKEEKEGDYTPQKPPNGGVGDGFDEFWARYPNKTGKQVAMKTWSKLKPNAELTKAILAAVEYQKTWEKWTKDNGRYIPNPATWLNQGRWEDEPPEPQKSNAMESWGAQNAITAENGRETAERLRKFRDSLIGGDA